ncbi:hypothetical protein L1887_51349 [Cichorium endivia]|nr:hypothetical protein L1887_51349 [Cichorium endivia]
MPWDRLKPRRERLHKGVALALDALCQRLSQALFERVEGVPPHPSQPGRPSCADAGCGSPPPSPVPSACKLGSRLHVQQHHDIAVRVGLERSLDLLGLDVARHLQIALDQIHASHVELARLHVPLGLVRSNTLEALANLADVLAQLATQHRPVGKQLEAHAALGLVRGQHEIAHVELRLDVVRSDSASGKVRVHADHAAQLHHRLERLELSLDHRVKVRLVHLGEREEVYAAVVLLVVRRGRGHVLAQALVQRRLCVVHAVLALEATAVEADVPVGQLVDQLAQTRHHRVQTVRRHLVADEADERLAAREDPAVHDVGARLVAVVDKLDAVVLLVQAHRGEEEAERVEPREEGGRDHLLDALLLEAQVLGTHDGRVDQGLAHLLAVGGEHESADDEVLPGRRVKEVRGEDEQRVEPAARLVEALGDKVVDARDAERRSSSSTEPTQTISSMSSLAPERDGGAPVSVAADVPVARVGDPVAEAALADVAGHPARALLFLTSFSMAGSTRTNHEGMAL